MNVGLQGLLHLVGAVQGAVDANDNPGQPDTPSRRGLTRVGAWVGPRTSMASAATMRKHVASAREIGLDRLDVILNDHSKARSPRRFDTFDPLKIYELCHEAHDQGLEVHLMSWIMPHAPYLEEMGDTLERLVVMLGAESVMLDAEEPWTQAKRGLHHADAVADHVSKWSFPIGVTGIGYAHVSPLKPLVEVASYACPQCYATRRNPLDPATVVPRLVDRWVEKLGAGRFVVGLPAYLQRQKAKGYTTEGAIRAAFAGARNEAQVSAVVYWSLRWIRQSKAVGEAIRLVTRELRAETAA